LFDATGALFQLSSLILVPGAGSLRCFSVSYPCLWIRRLCHFLRYAVPDYTVVLALIVVLSISSFCSAVAFVFGLHLRHSSSPFVSSFLRRYRRLRLGPRLFDITVAPLPPRAGLWDFAVDSRVWFGIWISRGVIAWFSWGLRAFLPREMVLFGDTCLHFAFWNLEFGLWISTDYGLVLTRPRSVGGGYCESRPIRATRP
jgi:hypothetical protein